MSFNGAGDHSPDVTLTIAVRGDYYVASMGPGITPRM